MTAGQILRNERWREGPADMLLMLIEQRFGVPPEGFRSQVKAADSNQLDTWAKAVLVASSLEDIFDRPSE